MLSLSNKASNPHVPPTPEQEAMNRAAEYLVLRMLFLSGQQVMHTPPGTAQAPYPQDGGNGGVGSGGGGVESGGDGTVAASTGESGVKDEDIIKVEDKLPEG